MRCLGAKGLPYLLALLVLPVGLAYFNTRDVPYQWDDLILVRDNPIVRDLGYFIDPSGAQGLLNYGLFRRRFVGFLTFAIEHRLHGGALEYAHALNILLHILNTLLVFAVTLLLLRTPLLANTRLASQRHLLALLTATLFGLHPIQTEAVNYLGQRFVPLSALFYLASLAAYLRSRIATARGTRSLLLLASLLTALLAFKTKENAATLPIALAAVELLFFEGGRLTRTLRLVPFFALVSVIPLEMSRTGLPPASAVFGAPAAASATEGASTFDADYLDPDAPRSAYRITQLHVTVKYLRLLMLPAGQNFDHDQPLLTSLAEPEAAGSGLLLVGLLGLMAWSGSRPVRQGEGAYRLLAWGLLWFFLGLSVEAVVRIPQLMAEYRLYLPSAGFWTACSALLWLGLDRLRFQAHRAERAWVAAAIGLAVLLGTLTYRRNEVWRTTVSLWSDTVRKSPRMPRAHYNLARHAMESGDAQLAVDEYRAALALAPGYAMAHNNLGRALLAQGQLAEALRHLQEAVRLAPGDALARNNLGVAYAELGLHSRAIDQYRAALRLNPASVSALNNLANAYLRAGHLEMAISLYEEALRLSPGHAVVSESLAAARREWDRRNSLAPPEG